MIFKRPYVSYKWKNLEEKEKGVGRRSTPMHADKKNNGLGGRHQITLRPVRDSAALRKEDGIWVFRTGKGMPRKLTDKVLNDLRPERAE